MRATPCRPVLPSTAYVFLEHAEPGERIGAVKRGIQGYWRTTLDDASWTAREARDEVRRLNELLHISPLLQECMLAGSIFGFDVPAANPAHYDAAARARLERTYWTHQDNPQTRLEAAGLLSLFSLRAMAI